MWKDKTVEKKKTKENKYGKGEEAKLWSESEEVGGKGLYSDIG